MSTENDIVHDSIQRIAGLIQSVTKVQNKEPAFTSIAEMNAAHLELLKQSRASTAAATPIDAVLSFLERGRRFGELLDRADDRHNAQSLLDYWAASPTVLGANRSGMYDPEMGLLAEFNEQSVVELQNRLSHWFEDVPKDQTKLANKILLGLTQLDPKSETFERVAVSLDRFPVGPDRENATKILRSLQEIGVVQPEPPDSTTDFVLTHAAVMRRTPRYRALLEQRLQFRKATQVWDKSGRDPSVLFNTGRLIDEVQNFHDLGPLEQQFADASRQGKINRQRIWLGVLGTLLFLSTALAGLAWSQFFRLKEDGKLISAKNDQLAATNETLELRTRQLSETTSNLKTANHSLVKKQELSIVTTIARSLAGISASDDPVDRDIARIRFRTMVNAYPEIAEQAAGDRKKTLALVSDEAEAENERSSLQVAFLNSGRRLKAEVLKYSSDDVKDYVRVERKAAFEIVRICAREIVESWEHQNPYQSASRYIVEFWTLYWADLAFVEQQQVESAMVAFGNKLKQIDEKVLSTIPENVIKSLPLWSKRGQLSNRQITSQIRQETEVEEVRAHAESVRSHFVDPEDVSELRGLFTDLDEALNAELKLSVDLQSPISAKR